MFANSVTKKWMLYNLLYENALNNLNSCTHMVGSTLKIYQFYVCMLSTLPTTRQPVLVATTLILNTLLSYLNVMDVCQQCD